jgi:hypothetical protein
MNKNNPNNHSPPISPSPPVPTEYSVPISPSPPVPAPVKFYPNSYTCKAKIFSENKNKNK